jgi:hypothetical protein
MLLDQADLLAELGQRAGEGVDLSGGGKLIQPAEGGDHPLDGAFPLPVILNDLEVATRRDGTSRPLRWCVRR